MKLAEAINEFILYLKGRQASYQTIRWYCSRLGRFASFTEKTGIPPFSRRAFRQFIAQLEEEAISVATIAGYIRALKHFGRWLYEEGWAEENFARGLKQPRLDDLPIKAISLQDAGRILEAARNEDNPLSYALVTVLRCSGARAGEILSLKWSFLDLERRHAFVRAKGGRMRIIFFNEEAAEALRKYRESLGDNLPDKVFPLTYDSLYYRLKRLARKAGVKGPWNPHAWRHAFGREMTMNGCPTAALQDLMGHSTPAVTKRYARLLMPELREIYDRFAPWR